MATGKGKIGVDELTLPQMIELSSFYVKGLDLLEDAGRKHFGDTYAESSTCSGFASAMAKALAERIDGTPESVEKWLRLIVDLCNERADAKEDPRRN